MYNTALQKKRTTFCDGCLWGRPAGYALFSERLFSVDATPPVLSLGTTTISGRSASFAFAARDNGAVSFSCSLERNSSSSTTAEVLPVPGSPPLLGWGVAAPCASPAVRTPQRTLVLYRVYCYSAL